MNQITPSNLDGSDNNQNNLAVGCHLLGFLGLLVPLGNILAPLALWLIKREGNPFVDYQGREAVNFQISFSLWGIIAVTLSLALVWTVIIPVLAVIALVILAVIWVVTMILAAMRASRGEAYRYPFTLRLLS